MSGLVAGIVGTAVSLTTAGVSFAQAAQQKNAKKRAEAEADAAIARARTALDVNYYEELAIAKEPYELQREASLAAGAQAIEAGREGDVRGVGATAGRVQMAQEQAQAQTRAQMAQEMQRLEELTAQEESRLRDIGIQLDLEEVAGAQMAARDAEQARQMAIQQGMQGVTSAAQQAASTIPLYAKTKDARQFNQLQRQYDQATKRGETIVNTGFSGQPPKQLSFNEWLAATTGDSAYASLTPLQAMDYYQGGGLPKDFVDRNKLQIEEKRMADITSGVDSLNISRQRDYSKPFGPMGVISPGDYNAMQGQLFNPSLPFDPVTNPYIY